MVTLFSFHLTTLQLITFAGVALLIGMAKTGIHGAGMVAVPLLAVVFGGQASTGILLPVLSFADLIGVWYYHNHASWKYLRILFPWAAGGVIAGVVVGGMINDHVFKLFMAVIIFISVVIMLWLERGHKEDIPDYAWFGALMGLAAGFTSMVGNLAASVMAVYLLSMRLPKNQYIGTTAWFFTIVNWFKIPFHVFVWHTITRHTFFLDLLSIPSILIGALIGVLIIKVIPEKVYRWFIIGTVVVAAIYMLAAG